MSSHPRVHDVEFLDPVVIGGTDPIRVKITGAGFDVKHEVSIEDASGTFFWTPVVVGGATTVLRCQHELLGFFSITQIRFSPPFAGGDVNVTVGAPGQGHATAPVPVSYGMLA